MKNQIKDYKAYFGIFTFKLKGDPNFVWEGLIKETRIEACPIDDQDSNRMGVMYLYGRKKMNPKSVAICEIVPLSQDIMHDIKTGNVMTIKHGSTELGEFELLYIGNSTI